MGPLSEGEQGGRAQKQSYHRVHMDAVLFAGTGMNAEVAGGMERPEKARVKLPCCLGLAADLSAPSLPRPARARGGNNLLRSLRWLTKLRLLGSSVVVRYGRLHPPGTGCQCGKRIGDTWPKGCIPPTREVTALLHAAVRLPRQRPVRIPGCSRPGRSPGRSRDDPAP